MRIVLPTELIADIEGCGYFPELIIDNLALSIGMESVISHLVHQEAAFSGEEIHRHLTALVLTGTRLLVAHIDDQEMPGNQPNQAIMSVESVALHHIRSVSLSHVVHSPERHGDGRSAVIEAWLSLSWGVLARFDVEPAHCDDPTCEADHGLTGQIIPDDLVVRVSAAADGPESVLRLIRFATTLQQARGRFPW